MQYKIEKLKQAQKEIDDLTNQQKSALEDDYKTIENRGLEYVKRRYLREGLFEIKTKDVRSLFKYKEESVILIGLVYEKRTEKAPDYYIKLALKRLKEV